MEEANKENDSEIHETLHESHSDSGSGSGSPRPRRNSSGRLAPREGQMLNETIKAHAIEADEVLHSSMEEDDLMPATLSKTRVKFHSTSALPDKPSTSTNSQFSTEITPSFPSLARPRVGRHTRIGKAKSTPLSLNQIHEERESDLEDSPVNSPRVERTRKHHLGGGVMKSKRTTRRLSPVPSGGSRRSSSCSSSDEDEIEKHMRRLKTTSGCKLSSRRANNDDGNPDGDNGGGTGVGGGSSLGTTITVPSENGSSGDQSSTNKNSPSKQESNGKSNCLNLVNGFVPLCEDLDVIEESNKENVDNNMGDDVQELENKDKTEVCNGKMSPLIEEYGVLASKGEIEQDRNCFLDKRNSASKYIRKNRNVDGRTLNWSNDSEQDCNRNKRNSLEGVVNIELTDMSLQSKDTKRLVEDTKKNMRLLKNPAIQTVTSNCCQIF